jgi:cation diffusion facilitator family transporter
VICLVKVIVGINTGSVAILSEAFHSFTDLVNNVVALILQRFASAPPDEQHPYGHHKFEYLAVFGLAVVISMVGFEIALRALFRNADDVVTQSGAQLALLLGVFGLNVVVAIWEARQARRYDSDLLRADARHTLSDVLTTFVVILGWQVAARGYLWVDTVLSLLVAGIVFYLAYGLFARAIPILVDAAIIAPEVLAQRARSVRGVREVGRIRSHYAGSHKVVDVTVRVDAGLSTGHSHEIADAVEAVLKTALGDGELEVIVHVEPAHES